MCPMCLCVSNKNFNNRVSFYSLFGLLLSKNKMFYKAPPQYFERIFTFFKT
jgi:hypothetical protein